MKIIPDDKEGLQKVFAEENSKNKLIIVDLNVKKRQKFALIDPMLIKMAEKYNSKKCVFVTLTEQPFVPTPFDRDNF